MSSDNLDDLSKDPLGTIADAAVNIQTAGLAGYKNGRVTKGAAVVGLDETLGEITGRNMARKQSMIAEDRLAMAEQEQIAEMKDEAARSAQLDVARSNTAAGIRKTAAQRRSGLLGPASDFLGL